MAGELLAQKAKITLTDFNPKQIAAQPETVKRLTLGTLIGRATGMVERQAPDKSQTFKGLGGDFEAYFSVPQADGSIPAPWKSGVLFMPDTFLEPLLRILMDETNKETGEVVRPGADAVQFAFNIAVQRAGNAQGYEWVLDPLMDQGAEQAVDPLARTRALLAGEASAVRSLEVVKKLALPAPEKATDEKPEGGRKPRG